ncbi:Ppx/GppA phosphatase family protein [Wenzhouxiangella limi]|uniref:Ppx/GppA family phosphatase n=1 Tax=Wenzhouxiangella limi TaxID=2707351 RepID=A0A845UZB3_9GAMM|nr:Ppx/GppA phosphatase family protein [Wenzhouxiangella limi]NDY96727.1 Ppx/GppA family phosphatase [Wenzhouxiangella limi]
MPERQVFAAVDLGSNSFHMLVARAEHNELRVIDRIKEMVRLGGGLDEQGNLDRATREAAVLCLARFGQRLAGIPAANMRAVGTQTFRRLRHPAGFLVVAETALGCPIDIVSGREEARLVYTGVSQGMPAAAARRLVIDIGGGSTELVAGEAVDPELAESLAFGCVATTREAFPDGRITPGRWRRAKRRIMGALRPYTARFRAYGWDQAVGSSGTMRAVDSMIRKRHPDRPAGFCRDDLIELRSCLFSAGHIDRISLAGLSERRRPVIAGGLVILDALMKALSIERLQTSDFALREGLLYDLMGRLGQQDPRDKTINAMAVRYECDQDQADRVCDWTRAAFEQVGPDWELTEEHRDLLMWAARLHEIGLAIAHEHYPAHSAYIVEHADMPGFGRHEQALMATLVGQQRERPDLERIQRLPPRLHQSSTRMLALLRLAVLMSRAHSDADFCDFALKVDKKRRLNLSLPPAWLESHPLTAQDLTEEAEHLQALGFSLRLGVLQTAIQE